MSNAGQTTVAWRVCVGRWADHRGMEGLCRTGFSPVALFSLTSASSDDLKILVQPEETGMVAGVT